MMFVDYSLLIMHDMLSWEILSCSSVHIL